jgi:hypothetical protein
MYNSPSVSSQGTTKGFFSSDVAVRQDLFNKQLSLTLQIRDIFRTAKWESTSQGIDFYTYNYSTRESPVVMLNIKFNFNNYKDDERERNRGEQQDNGFNDEF